MFTLQIITSNRFCDDDHDFFLYGVDYDNDYVPKLELRNYSTIFFLFFRSASSRFDALFRGYRRI